MGSLFAKKNAFGFATFHTKVFREAKNRVKEQEQRAERRERKWRANRALLDKSLNEGEGDRKAYVSPHV